MEYVAAFFRPSPEINYKVISVLHLFFSMICLGMYFVEMYDLFGEKAVEGYWVILSPCVPSLFWSLFLYWRQSAEQSTVPAAKKDQ